MRARLLVVLLLITAAVDGCGGVRSTTTAERRPTRPKQLVVYAAGKRIEVVRRGQPRIRLPQSVETRRGRALLRFAIPSRRASRSIRRALAAGEAQVELPVVHLRTTITLRPVRQVLHNDCEATALSMLLAAAGVRVGQRELQARLPQSGPLDPTRTPSGLLRWGDPERGFVGRADGGGTEGGFGVYEPPIRALAARYGVRLVDLHGRTVGAVRAAVLAGHPVLAWVGLAAGPFLTWLTPAGRTITVNLNEHAVVLVGAGKGYVVVDDPLSGTRERWSAGLFSYRWKLLGRRALELPGR